MKSSTFFFLFIFLFDLPSPVVQSCFSKKSTLDKVLKGKILKVGTTGDYQPYSYYPYNNDTLAGVDIDLAYDLASSLNVSIQFVMTSWSNLTYDLMHNKFDIAMSGITKTYQRQQVGFLSVPYFNS
eukprot:Pgem_evm1s3837